MMMFIVTYQLASEDGYMETHPETKLFVIMCILFCVVFGVGFIYLMKLRRVFYSKKGIIKDRGLLEPIFIESREISRIVYTITSCSVSISIFTFSNGGTVYIDSSYMGFDEFNSFIKSNFENKIEVISKVKKKKGKK